jgi:hypothetical protein
LPGGRTARQNLRILFAQSIHPDKRMDQQPGNPMTPDTHPLVQLIQKRILVLDGAMGTMVQRYKLDEAAFRGERFANWTGKDLKGNNEILLLTRPQVIAEIHRQYFEAGSDIVETNTFGATAIGQHDFLFQRASRRAQGPGVLRQGVIHDPFLRGSRAGHEPGRRPPRPRGGRCACPRHRRAAPVRRRRHRSHAGHRLPFPDVNDPGFPLREL